MVTHPYDELLVFMSTNVKDQLDLGAEVTVTIGDEQESYTFDKTQICCIPRGVPHKVTVNKVDHAFLHYVIALSDEYFGEITPVSALNAPVAGSAKYADCCKVFKWYVDPVTGLRIMDKYGNPEEYKGVVKSNLDQFGVSHPRNKGDKGPGNAENIVWMFGEILKGFEVNTLFGHYTDPGIWHRAGESHSHPAEEIILYLGLDADDPMNIGAECETFLGEEGEVYVCSQPTLYYFPRGFAHLPQITRWVDRPFGFMVVEMEKTHDSPWKDRDGTRGEYED